MSVSRAAPAVKGRGSISASLGLRLAIKSDWLGSRHTRREAGPQSLGSLPEIARSPKSPFKQLPRCCFKKGVFTDVLKASAAPSSSPSPSAARDLSEGLCIQYSNLLL